MVLRIEIAEGDRQQPVTRREAVAEQRAADLHAPASAAESGSTATSRRERSWTVTAASGPVCRQVVTVVPRELRIGMVTLRLCQRGLGR